MGFVRTLEMELRNFIKKLAYRCMNSDPNQRPTADELDHVLEFWWDSNNGTGQDVKQHGYYGGEIKEAFHQQYKKLYFLRNFYGSYITFAYRVIFLHKN